jgi:hypothetical protein
MLEEINRQEMEESIFQMSIHGIDKNTINTYRDNVADSGKTADEKVVIQELGSLGMKKGRGSGTKVINR